MGTSNFHYKDDLHVVELEDEWSYNDLTINMNYHLKELKEKCRSKNKKIELAIYANSKPEYHHEGGGNSFCASEHGTVTATSIFMGMEIDLTLQVLVRSGYYEHANIDYAWRMTVDGCDYDEDADAYDMMRYNYDVNDGLKECNREFFDKRLEEMRTLVQEVFGCIAKELSTQYVKSAQASNGECSYNKVEEKEIEHDMLEIAA